MASLINLMTGEILALSGASQSADPILNSVLWSGAASVDMGASWTSDWIDILDRQAYSIHLNWAGADTPTGELSLEMSNDTTYEACLWDISVTPIAGASAVLWDGPSENYRYVRAKYTRTSGGTGDSCTGIFLSKG